MALVLWNEHRCAESRGLVRDQYPFTEPAEKGGLWSLYIFSVAQRQAIGHSSKPAKLAIISVAHSAKLWVRSSKSPQSPCSGRHKCFPQIGVEFGLQIGDNQPGTTLGAEDYVRRKMTEGPTHAYLCRPAGA